MTPSFGDFGTIESTSANTKLKRGKEFSDKNANVKKGGPSNVAKVLPGELWTTKYTPTTVVIYLTLTKEVSHFCLCKRDMKWCMFKIFTLKCIVILLSSHCDQNSHSSNTV